MQEVRQQRAHCTIRKGAMVCLKELEGLLCGEGEQLIIARPHVHALLLADMRGPTGQESAPAQTPHLLRTPQTTGKTPAGQASTQAQAHTDAWYSPQTFSGLPKNNPCQGIEGPYPYRLSLLRGCLHTSSLQVVCSSLICPSCSGLGLGDDSWQAC